MLRQYIDHHEEHEADILEFLHSFVFFVLFVVNKAEPYWIFKTITKRCLLGGALLSLPLLLNAQITTTAYSPPLGGIELTAGELRETPFGIPLHRSAVMIANLTDVSDPETDDQGNFKSMRLILDRAIGDAGAYNPNYDSGLPAHYLEIVTGAAAGERFAIAGSGEDWVVIEQEPQGALLASFDSTALRDQIRIRPCWTPETLMPAADAPLTAHSESATQMETRDGDAMILLGHPSLGQFATQRLLQRFSDNLIGVHYWAEWVDVNERVLADDYGILPGQVSRIRRASSESFKWSLAGDVTNFNTTWAIPIPTAGSVLEWPFSLTESRPETLDSSGLKMVLRASASAAERNDELIVWENQTGFYTRPAKRFYLQTASPDPIWREVGDTVTDQGTYTLEPGKAYTIRRRGE